jgi:hypothetical protein
MNCIHLTDDRRQNVASCFTKGRKFLEFSVLLSVYYDISVQQEPTRCTVYFQFISVINLCMFRAGLLLIIRMYYSVYTAIDRLLAESILPTASQRKRLTYTKFCIYRQVPPDDEQ